MKVSIVIPNFNGEILLKQNIPAVIKTKADEIIVVDDASHDNSISLLQKQFPSIQVLAHEKNQGYGQSINDGITAATGDIVFLLNTDTRPQEDCLAHMAPYFENPLIFAVTCHEPGNSWATGTFSDGYFHHEPGNNTQEKHISLYASGGSAAFSRQKFIDLGMYDSIYRPFYWEDTDISYRAWKHGWEIWWEPKAIVLHETSSTINKYFSKGYRNYIVQRNELLFNWKNITDEDLFSRHKKAVLKRLLSHPGYFRVVLGALKHLAQVQKSRQFEKTQSKRSDKEIFQLFAHE